MTTLTEVKETEFIVSNISLVLLYLNIPLLVGLLKLKKKISATFYFPKQEGMFSLLSHSPCILVRQLHYREKAMGLEISCSSASGYV